MATSSFPLRFKDPRTKDMLRLVAAELGVPMNEVAEEAIRHELILLGGDLERELTDIVEALRSYEPERDLDHYLDLFEEGEGLGDPLQARQLQPRSTKKKPAAATAIKPLKTPKKKLTAGLAAFDQR